MYACRKERKGVRSRSIPPSLSSSIQSPSDKTHTRTPSVRSCQSVSSCTASAHTRHSCHHIRDDRPNELETVPVDRTPVRIDTWTCFVPWRGRERDWRTCSLRVGQACHELRHTSTLRSASASRFRGVSSRSCCRSGGGRMCGCSRRGGYVVWCVFFEFSFYQSIHTRRRRIDRSET